MPGNDIDGGFSTHFLVPARPLIKIGASSNVAALSVVADAVSTAYQAILRANVAAGDAVIVIGAGGVGGFVVQIANALGARVVACDIIEERLKLIAELRGGRDHQSGEPGPQGTPQAGAGFCQRRPHAEI